MYKSKFVPTAIIALVLALSAQLFAQEPDANLTLDASTVRYSIQGLGGNYVFGGLDNPITKHTLKHLPLAFSRVQMQLENLKPFAEEKDLDAAVIKQITDMDKPKSAFRASMRINAELARRKVPCIISIWRLPDWMYTKTAVGNGNTVADDKWPALLAAIGQYLKYSKDKYGFEPIAFSFNEPDMGVHVKFTATEHRDAIKKIGAHLDDMKLKTRMALGDVVHPSSTIQYLNPTLDDPEALKYCSMVTFHSWGGAKPEEYAKWPALANKLKLPLIVAEAGPNSRALKDGSLNTPKQSLAEMAHYQQLFLYACPNAVIHWEYTPDFRLLDKDPADPKKLVPNFRYALQKHWLTFVPPKSNALKTESDQPQVLFTAFQNEKNYTLQISNNGPTRKAIITGLPASVRKLNVVTSELSSLVKKGEAIEIKDGTASIELPADSFSTLTTLRIPRLE